MKLENFKQNDQANPPSNKRQLSERMYWQLFRSLDNDVYELMGNDAALLINLLDAEGADVMVRGIRLRLVRMVP